MDLLIADRPTDQAELGNRKSMTWRGGILTNARYNFLSTFSGTHYVTRTMTAQIGFNS